LLLHLIKPKSNFDDNIDEHSDEVYQKGVDNYKLWKENGWLKKDDDEQYYIYAQTMNGRAQYGLVACCGFQDHTNGAIEKHALTRPDKEEDRMRHVREQNANIEPVFFSCSANEEIDQIVAKVVAENQPEYDFVADGGFGYRF